MAARKQNKSTEVLRLDVNYFSRRYVLLTVLIRKESQRFHNVYITFWFPLSIESYTCIAGSGQRVKGRIKCTFYQRLDSPRAATFPIPASFFVCLPPIYQASRMLSAFSTGSRGLCAGYYYFWPSARNPDAPGLAHFFVVITAFTRQPGEVR
jgi:hypothetical protein